VLLSLGRLGRGALRRPAVLLVVLHAAGLDLSMKYVVRATSEGSDLYRVESDGTETYLGTDEMAPEDVMFARDLAWVPEEMNRLAEALEHRNAQVAVLAARVIQVAKVAGEVATRIEKCANTVAANHPAVRRKLCNYAARLRGDEGG
jgi:hypothetical protein